MIEMQHISKRYGVLDVLRDFSMSTSAGRTTAVVGPNGSGKTTLIKCLLGLVHMDAGTVLEDGQPVKDAAGLRAKIGYMPQRAPFPDNLTPREVIAMLKDLRGAGVTTDETLIDAFELTSEMDKLVRNLSGGTRQKVSAAVAFLFQPQILVLDEPTAGLDPVASSILKDRIVAAASAGSSVLLTSHIMSEIEELADDIVFLLEGAARFRGSVKELKQRTGHSKLERAVASLMNSGMLLVERAA